MNKFTSKWWQLKKERGRTLSRQLEKALLLDIRAGLYREGDQLPSVRELDARLSLGRETVVSALQYMVRDGYAESRHGAGHYVATAAARELIGLILPVDAGYQMHGHAQLATALQLEAERHGHHIKTIVLGGDPRLFISAVDELVLDESCRWLAAVPPIEPRSGRVSLAVIHHLRRRQGRLGSLLLLGRGAEPLPQLLPDRARGEELLLGRTRAAGASHVAMLCTGERLPRKGRLRGKVTLLSDMGPAANLARVRKGGFDAVLCENDLLARRLLDLAGPGPGFMVAGYGATPMATAVAPRITTVDPDFAAMGRMAFGLLAKRRTEGGTTLVEPVLVPGETL